MQTAINTVQGHKDAVRRVQEGPVARIITYHITDILYVYIVIVDMYILLAALCIDAVGERIDCIRINSSPILT